MENYEKEREQEEIFQSLKQFKTINEINRSFGIPPPQGSIQANPDDTNQLTGSVGSARDSTMLDQLTAGGKDAGKKMVPLSKRAFERFFEIKQ